MNSVSQVFDQYDYGFKTKILKFMEGLVFRFVHFETAFINKQSPLYKFAFRNIGQKSAEKRFAGVLKLQ